MSEISRRALLQSATLAMFTGVPQSVAAQGQPHTGWEHYRGNLGGVWEVWRGKAASDNVAWRKVNLPHCFNARDCVDPDEAYYEGPGWYRTTLQVDNPYPNGRTLLHFEGAGQKTTVYVNLVQVGHHVGDTTSGRSTLRSSPTRAAHR